MSLYGLSQINVEISSFCGKRTKCNFCGHQDPNVHPNLRDGVMSWVMMQKIAAELRPLGKQLVVQAHRDGDPCDAPNLKEFLYSFHGHIRSIVTHGETLGKLSAVMKDNCEAVVVSIFRADPDRAMQLESLREFLDYKGTRLPRVSLKVVGDMSNDELRDYEALSVPIMRRLIHIPRGSTHYAHRMPVVPEHGLCQDLLSHPSIAWDGRVFTCNRLDVHDKGMIGHLEYNTLDEIWNGTKRQRYIQAHIQGLRKDVPLCADCDYYGVPSA